MGEIIDKTKGKIKEVVGNATGDKSLENEGKMDTLKGNVKGAIDTAKTRVKDAVNDAKRDRDVNTNPPR